ncbi:DUF1850 domain-containing protein [Natronolimnohabitans sp. A-GB9]|uniref:DUF1850 domain-containing protein n=1 Tax=Natronolimnohabitans sp. A-GB9 TaxID=3069757 RepID=UPI0027B0FD31|nr:DUF1850 domain-containing protein [Natronolimnohabitans sp. A-GB9]MDQ2052811.1 DUF1850 domain-containing protein [Natronolimnohabitans sp. A-GB9]
MTVARVAVALTALVTLVVCAVLAAVPAGTIVHVEHGQSGEIRAVYPIDDGEEFAIEYVHSSEGTPIREVYTVDGTSIVQVREEYAYYAAGLEFERETRQVDGWTVADVDREVGSVTIRTAATTEQRLLIADENRSLETYTEPWEPVTLSVEHVTYLEYIMYETRARM